MKNALLMAILLWTARAQAHAFLEKSDPAVGSAVKEAPKEVSIVFTEPLEPHFSRLQVFAGDGREIDRQDAHLDAKNSKRLIVSLPLGLGAGEYKVVWRAVSVDTHVTGGDFKFRVDL